MLAPESLSQPTNDDAAEQERRAIASTDYNQAIAGNELERVGAFGAAVPLSRLRVSVQEDMPRAQRGIIAAFSNTCHRWKLPIEAHFALLGYSDTRYLGEQILYGRLAPPQDAKDRAGCILSISIGLGALFNENPDAELRWLNTPSARLGHRAPLAFMLEGKMGNLFRVLAEVERARGV